MRRPFSLFCLTLAALLSPGHAFARQNGEPAAPAPPTFEFHSGFWVNLHQFLYLEGRVRNLADQNPSPGAQRESLPAVAAVSLTPDQQKQWDAAVRVYAADLSLRDLSNSDLELINDHLAEFDNCTELSGRSGPACRADLRPDLVAALERAAPIYRARWWPAQDAENRAWIAAAAPLVRQMGATLALQLAVVYQQWWPAERIRVDVAWFAGPEGAYTSLNSLDVIHVTVSGADRRNAGLAALEVVFDQASQAISRGVNQAIAREYSRRDIPIPRELGPALVYYTTGEIVRRALANAPPDESGTSAAQRDARAQYVPYAQRNGLYDGPWLQYRESLDRYWRPYLNGQLDFDTAISRLVAGL
jgi:hypothetical protein